MEEEILLLLILHSFGALCFVAYILLSLSGSKGFPRGCPRSLLVVAHPDDEVMFFGPTVSNLTRESPGSLHLLVLSTGNFGGQGDVRKGELYASAAHLGIPKDNITLLNYSKLQDDPKARWSEELLADTISQYAESNDIEVILSFDRGGVSGHKNHTSVYNALLLLNAEGKRGSGNNNSSNVVGKSPSRKIFVLNSVNVLRKYSGIFDLPMSHALAPTSFIAGPRDWLAIQRAMASYGSQYVWFRKLYMAFSRYVLINTYDTLK